MILYSFVFQDKKVQVSPKVHGKHENSDTRACIIKFESMIKLQGARHDHAPHQHKRSEQDATLSYSASNKNGGVDTFEVVPADTQRKGALQSRQCLIMITMHVVNAPHCSCHDHIESGACILFAS